MGMTCCDRRHGTRGYHNAVMLPHLFENTGKGDISTKVGDRTLQTKGAAPASNTGNTLERAAKFAALWPDRRPLLDTYSSKGAVPVEFFLP